LDADWKSGLSAGSRALADYIVAAALAYPETRLDMPWGHPAIKVKDKAFVFTGASDGTLGISLKLPDSYPFALDLPFATPTGYGPGRAHWVSFKLATGKESKRHQIAFWIGESYRAVAPKSLLRKLAADGASL
jgi:predicted DNA-binding protein (MmcQ/YjbR family)